MIDDRVLMSENILRT